MFSIQARDFAFAVIFGAFGVPCGVLLRLPRLGQLTWDGIGRDWDDWQTVAAGSAPSVALFGGH